ncbi:MAG: hypothetical protein IKW90_01450 [Lachnospiraceae bacterium]|nr:hypothetical protein [Lachnospiraceae bacterium]
MKMTKKTVLAFLLIAVLAMLCGCSKTTSVESWAYNFDKSAEILKLNSDGTASYVLKVYENGVQVKKTVEYKSYKKDDSFITLTDKDGGELKLRYVKTDDGINLYEKTEYEQILKKEGNAVAGVWVDKNNSDYFYEFTEDGAFNEDGYFTGKYTVDEKECRIDFTYDGDSSKSVLYYTISGDSLIVEYPWPMVPTEKSQDSK